VIAAVIFGIETGRAFSGGMVTFPPLTLVATVAGFESDEDDAELADIPLVWENEKQAKTIIMIATERYFI